MHRTSRTRSASVLASTAVPASMPLTKEKKQRADRQVRPRRRRHRLRRGPGRAAHRADQRAHRAPAHAQQGPPLAPRPADAGRQAPAHARATSSASDLERYRALVAELGLRAMIARRRAGARLHAPRPGRASRSRSPTSGAARCCSSSTRSTSARSAPTSSRSTRRSCRRSRRRASSWSGSASTRPALTRRSARSSESTIPLLADFEPKGEVDPRLRRLPRGGRPRQPLAGAGRRGGDGRAGCTNRPRRCEIPGANLIFDALPPSTELRHGAGSRSGLA